MDFQIELAHGAKAAPHNVSNHNLHVVAQPRCQMTTLMAGGLSPALVAKLLVVAFGMDEGDTLPSEQVLR
ncbi:MAG: hypothetical protein WAN14_05385 [Candidatus Acidiferrales bacterium]